MFQTDGTMVIEYIGVSSGILIRRLMHKNNLCHANRDTNYKVQHLHRLAAANNIDSLHFVPLWYKNDAPDAWHEALESATVLLERTLDVTSPATTSDALSRRCSHTD